MKITKKICFMMLVIVVYLSVFAFNSYAAVGLEGYAVYRDGVIGQYTWHAGLMNAAQPNMVSAVVHAVNGDDEKVMYGSWSDFLDGNNFKGVYAPKTAMTSNQRDLVTAMGERLVDENITYNLATQLRHSSTVGSGEKIEPDKIISMRCDGVVEYCYEYYNIRIYGSDQKWNISINGNQAHHSLANIKPDTQAEEYMTPWFNVINVNSNKGLEVINGNLLNGTDVQQWAVSGTGLNHQKWRLDYTLDGDYFSLIPKHSTNQALEITNASTAENEVFQVWDIPSSGYMNSQKLKLYIYTDGSIAFRSYPNNYTKVMSVINSSTANGASVVQTSTPGAANKRWKLVPVAS